MQRKLFSILVVLGVLGFLVFGFGPAVVEGGTKYHYNGKSTCPTNLVDPSLVCLTDAPGAFEVSGLEPKDGRWIVADEYYFDLIYGDQPCPVDLNQYWLVSVKGWAFSGGYLTDVVWVAQTTRTVNENPSGPGEFFDGMYIGVEPSLTPGSTVIAVPAQYIQLASGELYERIARSSMWDRE